MSLTVYDTSGLQWMPGMQAVRSFKLMSTAQLYRWCAASGVPVRYATAAERRQLGDVYAKVMLVEMGALCRMLRWRNMLPTLRRQDAMICQRCGVGITTAVRGSCRTPCGNCREPYPAGDCGD